MHVSQLVWPILRFFEQAFRKLTTTKKEAIDTPMEYVVSVFMKVSVQEKPMQSLIIRALDFN